MPKQKPSLVDIAVKLIPEPYMTTVWRLWKHCAGSMSATAGLRCCMIDECEWGGV